MAGEDYIIKYAFTYGPLMIFFLGVGYAAWKAIPVMAQNLTQLFREMIAALNSSTDALNNSTTALNANNQAMQMHHETVSVMRKLWEELQDRVNEFECPHTSKPIAKPIKRVKIM